MIGLRHGLILCTLAPILVVATGCTGSSAQEITQRDRHFISQQEIDEYGDGADLYTLVQRVRPMWLVKSGPHTAIGTDHIRVYVNGMRYENPTALRFYSGSDVASMQFLDPGRATARYGIGHSHGAIIVNIQGGGYQTP